ncbi:aldehyde ferredoxin oxidoreductase family protein [Metallumcola ferriviriculae]|uniref:Aldehyde ferredoxin oxidoreductase family protein n=1 Tax=Metallumcola ferriviriculae TaxID=3039180 RepID=A0AAU0URP3_9FIRM|nr:aldehyde ferredoxin oxidoreductase family protein [Desulfitibacteraceae bacterium MK1]
MKGFYQRLLRINVTDQSFKIEEIPEEVLQRFLGGKGLGSYLLLKNVPAKCDPLGTENKLIFTTGPACDTGLLGAARYGVFSKSPLTGGYAESYGGGKLGPALKRTGYDAVIIEGESVTPIYLEISDQDIKFHPAEDLWGKDTYATEDALKETAPQGAETVVIGPAGENLVRFACLENNYWRSAGRTGMGAVLGSKKVKGIVFFGSSKAPIADENLLKEAIKDIRDKTKDNAGVDAYRNYGTPVMVAALNNAQAFPTKYWSKGTLDNWEAISGDAYKDNFEFKPKACPHCPMACGKKTTVKEGRHKGLTVEGPEYETIYSFGGLCTIDDPAEILYFNDICDRLGMDTITGGNMVAMAIDASRRGLIEEKLEFGNADQVAKMLMDIAGRNGLGDVLADGIKVAAPKLGMAERAIHVKGLEPAGYDPRVLKGVGLGYATSARGACHLRATFYKPELAGMIDRDTTDGKADLYIQFENRLTVFNTMIYCTFFRDLIQWENLQKMIKAVTGVEYSVEELENMGNEVVSLTRRFNLDCGFTKSDDTLPKRFFDEPLEPHGKTITREALDTMLDDYYNIRNWDEQGVPKDFTV